MDYLILDCLFYDNNFSHLSLAESIAEVKNIRPKKKTYFIGTFNLNFNLNLLWIFLNYYIYFIYRNESYVRT